jgi:hypothetical protein
VDAGAHGVGLALVPRRQRLHPPLPKGQLLQGVRVGLHATTTSAGGHAQSAQRQAAGPPASDLGPMRRQPGSQCCPAHATKLGEDRGQQAPGHPPPPPQAGRRPGQGGNSGRAPATPRSRRPHLSQDAQHAVLLRQRQGRGRGLRHGPEVSLLLGEQRRAPAGGGARGGCQLRGLLVDHLQQQEGRVGSRQGGVSWQGKGLLCGRS